MRRSASQIIRNLENRIARLEKEANRKSASVTLRLDSKTLHLVEDAIAKKFEYEEQFNNIEVSDVNCESTVEITSNRGTSLIEVDCELHYTDEDGDEDRDDQSWTIEIDSDIANEVGPLTNPNFIFKLIREAVKDIDNLSQS
jgi:hypothetical protein